LIIIIVRISILTLLCFQLFILALRLPGCHNKRELLAFMLTLGFLGFKVIFPNVIYINEISTFLLIWSLKHYLGIILEDEHSTIWNITIFCTIATYIILILLGLQFSDMYTLYYLFMSLVLFIFPLIGFIVYYKNTHSKIILFLCITASATFILGGFDYIFANKDIFAIELSIWPLLLLICGSGYLIAHQGYLLGMGLHGLYALLGMKEKKMQEVYSRLHYTEQTLLNKDRFISMGILVTGLSHEFKNILSLIKSSAQFGIHYKEKQKKQASLKLIMENTELGMKSVINILEKVAANRACSVEKVSINDYLPKLVKIVRANYRIYNINVILSIHKNFIINVKIVDLEQALLNLLRNAAFALCQLPEHEKKIIEVVSDWEHSQGIIEVIDNAYGIPEDIATNIFEIHHEKGTSKGLGLYLTKMLVEQNNAELLYEPQEKGSSFKIIFSEDICSADSNSF